MADTLPLMSPVIVPLAPTTLLGMEINGFVIEQALSSGGMGVVYRARHPLLGRTAAVKVLRPEMMARADLRDRFVREAKALSAIRHSNVVEILNFGSMPNDAGQYLMMEMLEGQTLSEVISNESPMPAHVALRHCEAILLGLVAAHAVGVVHRDLKPANIILTTLSSGERLLKVLDFGLARQLDTTPEAPSRDEVPSAIGASLLAGTPEYISPEQASGKPVGAQGDLYALGVMLFEMLTGQLPFKASSSPWELLDLHINATPPRASSLNPKVPPEVDELVNHLLQKNPASRPASANAAREQVTQLLTGLELRRATPTMQLKRMLKPRLSVPALAAVMGLGALVMVGHLLLSEPSPSPLPSAAAAVTVPAPPLNDAMVSPQVTAVPVDVPQEPTPVNVVRTAPSPAMARAAATSTAPRRLTPRADVSCAPQWQSGAREQIEQLEKLALAKLPDDATAAQVGAVKDHARRLAGRVRTGGAAGCGPVESALQVWRAELR